ncbi:MAG: DUF4266 domain-containing protein [Pseudomonadota bacterium]
MIKGTLACMALALSGCAGVGQVEPWQKGILAKPAMSFQADPLAQKFTEHVHASREGASGGTGATGGGCGCY